MNYYGLFRLLEGNCLLIDIYKSFIFNFNLKLNVIKKVYIMYVLSKLKLFDCRNSVLNILIILVVIVY